jgi:hypothetical protein
MAFIPSMDIRAVDLNLLKAFDALIRERAVTCVARRIRARNRASVSAASKHIETALNLGVGFDPAKSGYFYRYGRILNDRDSKVASRCKGPQTRKPRPAPFSGQFPSSKAAGLFAGRYSNLFRSGSAYRLQSRPMFWRLTACPCWLVSNLLVTLWGSCR